MSNPERANGSDYEVAETFMGLREQVLQLQSHDLDENEVQPFQIRAVLMETGYPEAVATLVAISDGSASIYFSNGGGFIGAGEHESVNDISKEFIELANEFRTNAIFADQFPLPQNGEVRFYLVTSEGVYTAKANEDDLGYERHAFSPLFHKGHELITKVREVSIE